MKDLAVILLRDAVLPLGPLHSARDRCRLDFQDPVAALAILKPAVKRGVCEWIFFTRPQVVLQVENFVVGKVQPEELPQVVLCLCAVPDKRDV